MCLGYRATIAFDLYHWRFVQLGSFWITRSNLENHVPIFKKRIKWTTICKKSRWNIDGQCNNVNENPSCETEGVNIMYHHKSLWSNETSYRLYVYMANFTFIRWKSVTQISKKLFHLVSAEMYVIQADRHRYVKHITFPRNDSRWWSKLASQINVDSQIVN